MTEQDISNLNKIDNIVRNNLSLDAQSYKVFKEKLYNFEIDPFYQKYLSLGSDLRQSFLIPKENYKDIDKGWRTFQKFFPSFVSTFDITYDNYYRNKFTKGKQELKLFKAAKAFYEKNEDLQVEVTGELEFVIRNNLKPKQEAFENSFKEIVESIGEDKIPETDISLVVSFNFADWFLCSSGEKWHSCLSLNRDNESAFWAGLPGLIVDSNRCFIYITDGRKKTVNDITTDRFIVRTFGVLTEKDIVSPLRYYPQNFIPPYFIPEIVPFPLYKAASYNSESEHFEHWVSKNSFKPLRFKNGYTSFIYQDGSKFLGISKDNKVRISSGSGDSYYFNEYNKLYANPIYYFPKGNLSDLISENAEIDEFTCNCDYSCEHCGTGLSEDDAYWAYDYPYCEECYNEMFFSCEHCGETHYNEDCFYVEGEGGLCERCFNKRYFTCESCGEIHSLNEEVVHNDISYCQSCFDSEFFTCEECENIFPINEIKSFPYETNTSFSICECCLKNKLIEEEEKEEKIG